MFENHNFPLSALFSYKKISPPLACGEPGSIGMVNIKRGLASCFDLLVSNPRFAHIWPSARFWVSQFIIVIIIIIQPNLLSGGRGILSFFLNNKDSNSSETPVSCGFPPLSRNRLIKLLITIFITSFHNKFRNFLRQSHDNDFFLNYRSRWCEMF